MDEEEQTSSAGRRRGRQRKGGAGKWIVLGVVAFIVLNLVVSAAWVAFNFSNIVAAIKSGPQAGPSASEKEKGGTPGGTTAAKGATPRRMLAISVTKYLYCNPLVGGKNKTGASEFAEAVKGIAFRYQVPDGQLYLLSDVDEKLMPLADRRPMLKDIILDDISKFCESSRGQDRVLIYFGGHAVAKDGKAYLIPAEGDPTEPESLLPLAAVYDKLAACPAQQKVIVFDVCRLSTDDNAVRPGSEPMTEELETLLHTPPDGVQVLTSCSQGQTAAEFRAAEDADTPQGSAFLGALRTSSRKAAGKVGPADPFPVEQWAEATAARLSSILTADRKHTPKASGTAGDPVDANPGEAAPARFAAAEPPKAANPKDVQEVFAVLATPDLLAGPDEVGATMPAVYFPEDALKDYKPDVPVAEVRAMADKLVEAMKKEKIDPPVLAAVPPDLWKEVPKEQQHRVAALLALDEVRGKWEKFAQGKEDSVLKDGLSGKASDDLKKAVEKEQNPLADARLELSDLVEALTGELADFKKAGLTFQKNGEADTNKFWQATYRFALAQTRLRLAFVIEANLILGDVRTDNLPDSATGLRLVQRTKMKKETEREGKVALKQFGELAGEHKGTPFEVLAKQWRAVSLGLEWKSKRADADTTMGMEGK